MVFGGYSKFSNVAMTVWPPSFILTFLSFISNGQLFCSAKKVTFLTSPFFFFRGQCSLVSYLKCVQNTLVQRLLFIIKCQFKVKFFNLFFYISDSLKLLKFSVRRQTHCLNQLVCLQLYRLTALINWPDCNYTRQIWTTKLGIFLTWQKVLYRSHTNTILPKNFP